MADKRKTNKLEIESQLVSIKTELKDGVFIFSGPMSIGEFASKIKKSANDIISIFFAKGKMFNINQTLTEEQIAELCLEFGFDFQKEKEINASNFMETIEIKDKITELKQRPPIITVMGHVDHGKTTLIDKIRNSNIVSLESGGITQHTGAYQINYKKTKITFLDTPGHQAFTAMRARGAKITDIVVLVVAADDGVMPQTKEAIIHAHEAKVPIIVFVNKMDKPNVDPEKVKGELSAEDVVSEDWGGDVQFVYGSALKGDGIDKLFDAINLQAEMLEIKANANRLGIGVVIESRLDKGTGSTSTIIVQNGTLKARDFIVAGSKYGRIRTMTDTFGQKIDETFPGMPAIITGLNYTPEAGDKFFAFHDEKFAKNLAEAKAFTQKQKEIKSRIPINEEDGIKNLKIIIKTDVKGTAEAIKFSLEALENDETKIHIIKSSVGVITESDVLLAEASNAQIFTFNVKVNSEIKKTAESKKINIFEHNVIYKIIEDIQLLLKGMMAPTYEEKQLGEAKILKVIFYSKVGKIAGCLMEKGVVKAKCLVRVKRGEKIIHDGYLDSLQRGKDQAKIVETGKEFGCHIKKFDDIKEGDILQMYEMVEVEK